MASGVQQQIGIGQAQVLPGSPNPNAFVEQLNRQKRYKDERDRYDAQQKEQKEYDLFKIAGDALNLRDFNPIIHGEVRKAKEELAKQLDPSKMSRADAHMIAQNYAQSLGQISDQFNQADKLIALSKEEYKGDKRLNLGNIEALARKDLLDQYKTKGQIDLSENPFDRALNNNPEFALTDDSDYGVVDFKNARKQPLEGSYSKTNTKGGMDKFSYKTEHYPDLYDFKDNGDGKEPTITTKAEDTGITEKGMDKMLSEEAYGFYKLTPSNVVALNKRLKRKYPDINLGSQEAETLRRIEAYNDVESKKPQINASVIEKANPERSHSFYFGSGFGQVDPSQINNVYQRIKGKLKRRTSQGTAFLPASLLDQDEKDEVLKIARAAKADPDITQDELKLIEGDDGSVRIFGKNGKGEDDFIAFLGEVGTNLPRQADVKGKRGVVAEANKNKNNPSGNKPKTIKQNGYTYTLNEKTGQYE
jgi:hypothetical protein